MKPKKAKEIKSEELKAEDLQSEEIEKDEAQEAETKAESKNTKSNAGVEAETEFNNKAEVKDLMYVGPTIPNLIRHAIVFKDGILSPKVNEAIESYKPMKEMFVTIEDFPKAMMEIKQQTGALAIIYKNVGKRIRGKN